MAKYFTLDGINGKYEEDITLNLAKRLGKALSCFNVNKCIVGTTTCFSSMPLKKSLIEGLKESKIKVFDINISTRPELIYLSKEYQILAVYIGSSDETHEYTSLKVYKSGQELSDEEIDLLESSLSKPQELLKGEELEFFSIYSYIKVLKNFNISNDFKVAFDFANGSLTYLYKDILPNYSFRYSVIGNKADAKNVNESGINNLESLKQTIRLESCDYGFAFNADGSRLLAIDKNDNIYDGDKLIYVIAKYLLTRSRLDRGLVVISDESHPGLKPSIEKQGAVIAKTKPTEIDIKKLMIQKNAVLGGDNLGHIIYTKLSNTSDGFLIALYILSILSMTGKTLYEITQDFEEVNIYKKSFKTYDDKILSSAKFKKDLDALLLSLNNPNAHALAKKRPLEDVLEISVAVGDDKANKEFMSQIKTMLNAS